MSDRRTPDPDGLARARRASAYEIGDASWADMIIDAYLNAPPEQSHVTRTNPSGEVRQCDRRDLHEAHEWQTEFGGYFNAYCPGNDGTKR